MIGLTHEYEKMYAVERELWWYKALHKKVLDNIQKHFSSKNISILDVACGTGGLLSFLSENGYKNLSGFDGSPDAVALTQRRGFDVSEVNILAIEKFVPNTTFDVIVCNDFMGYFTDNELFTLFNHLLKFTNPNLVLICNNPAFQIFYGSHDEAVACKRRLVKKDIEAIFQKHNLKLLHSTYWPFLLSPLILVIRLLQNLKMKIFSSKNEKLDSDIDVPPKFINNILAEITFFEERISKNLPFGSSIFTVFKSDKC